jgi:hypothetical protein
MMVLCAVCGREVDRLVIIDDNDKIETVIRAECHGQTDTMRLTHAAMLKMSIAELADLASAEGVAFQQQRLSAPC